MKPLIWKELRENVRWMPIGLLVIAAVCWMVHPSRQHNSSLLATNLVTQFAIITPLLAFALGVVQAYRDLQPAAGAYLNHRGVTASEVFLAKTISGFAIYLVSVLVPLLVLAVWVAYHGMIWFPMRPAQVIPGFVFAMAAFAMHPAAMLMMARSASWWGTRLFPLIPAAGMLAVFYGYLHNGGLYWASIGLLVGALGLAWLIAVARQGWQSLASDPSPATVNPRLEKRWLLPTYMMVGTTLGLITAVGFGIAMIEDLSRSNVYIPTPSPRLAIETKTEKLWLITGLQDYDADIGNYTQKTIGGQAVTNGASSVDAMAGDAKDHEFRNFTYLIPIQDSYNQSDGFFTPPNNSYGSSLAYAYDTRGYLLGYEQYPQSRWVKTIAADGVHPAGTIAGKPFKHDPIGNGYQAFASFANAGYRSPLVDSDGVYFIDEDPIAIRKLIDMPIDGVTAIEAGGGKTPRLVVRSVNQLHEYRLIDQSGSEDWYVAPELGTVRVNRPLATKVKLSTELVRTFTLPDALLGTSTLGIAWTPDSIIVNDRWPRLDNPENTVIYRLRPDAEAETIAFSIDPESLPKTDEDSFSLTLLVAGMVPGVVAFFGLTLAIFMAMIGHEPSNPLHEIASYPIATGTFLIVFVAVTAISFWLVRRASHRRGLSAKQTRWWVCSIPLLGLAAPLSIIALYRIVHREPCPSCGAARRVDLLDCEHCGSAWQPPADHGIEIVDRAA